MVDFQVVQHVLGIAYFYRVDKFNVMKRLIVWLLILISAAAWSQSSVDSLQQILISDSLSKTDRIDALNELAFQIRRSDPARSFKHALDALATSREIRYKKGEGIASNTLGEYYWARSSFEKSLEYAQQSLKIFEEIEYKKGLMDSFMLLGLTYSNLNDTTKAFGYWDKSLQLAKEIKSNEGLARVHNVLGVNALRVQKYDKALAHYFEAMQYLRKDDKIPLKVVVLANIAAAYITKDKLDEALAFLNQSLELGNKQQNYSGLSRTYMTFGDLYKRKKEFVKAEASYTMGQKLAIQVGDKRVLQGILISMIDLKQQTGKDKEAHAYQMRYSRVRDSIFNAEKAQQIAELELRYETQKKEHTIELLEREQQAQSVWRNALIAGVGIVSIGALVIFFLQRSRTRKADELLKVQQQLNTKLNEVNRLNSRFFANVSHELRTPLSLILAPLEEIQKNKQLTAEEKDMLLLMRRNANRLLDLVNQLLDLSKLEAGKMGLKVRAGQAEPFLTIISSPFDSWAQLKHIQFSKNIHLNNEIIWFDQDKIEKIITNLLSNAFKFTPAQGSVKFMASINERNTKRMLSLTVSDTGPGISEDEQEMIFSPFYQTMRSNPEGQLGTGIGLSLVKELIKLYGGTISMQSKVGTGTTFMVELPIEKNAFMPWHVQDADADQSLQKNLIKPAKEYWETEDLLEQESEAELNGKDTVLVVEDNADLRTFITTVLKNSYSVITAANGEEALDLSKKFVPNLVLSDLMMPKMDGIQLTSKLKNDECTSHIPVILLTAKNESDTRLKGLKTGADDYLTKPFSTEELLVRITNLIEQRKLLTQKFRERILVPNTPIEESSLEDKFLHKVRTVVEQNLGDYLFTVERLADEMNLSRTQLLRKLRALTSLTPNEFIKDMRLKRAGDMIRQRVDTITQIGYAVGFNDQSYFTKCFKKHYGVTPTEYAAQFSKGKESVPV